MKVSEKYSSKYLTVADLQGCGELSVQIDHLEEDVVMGMPNVEKDVLHFAFPVAGKTALVLSPTNAKILAQALGDDSDGWGGANIKLRVEDATIPWIKVLVPSKPTKQNSRPYDEAVYDEANPPPHTAGDSDDSIPF